MCGSLSQISSAATASVLIRAIVTRKFPFLKSGVKTHEAAGRLHAQACAYLEKDVLALDEPRFVLDHWQESANHINRVASAFFTPRRSPVTCLSK